MSWLRSEKLCSGPEIVKPELQRQWEEAATGSLGDTQAWEMEGPGMGQFGFVGWTGDMH